MADLGFRQKKILERLATYTYQPSGLTKAGSVEPTFRRSEVVPVRRCCVSEIRCHHHVGRSALRREFKPDTDTDSGREWFESRLTMRRSRRTAGLKRPRSSIPIVVELTRRNVGVGESSYVHRTE